jgi:hypothetical protein
MRLQAWASGWCVARRCVRSGQSGKKNGVARAVIAVAGCGVLTGILAVATWGDGDPGPWIWISVVCAPLATALGGVAWLAGRASGALARAATLVSAVVTAFWAFVLASLIAGA